MRKITSAIFMLVLSTGVAFAQSSSKNEKTSERKVMGAEEVRTGGGYYVLGDQPETPIFSEDFSSGIPSTWVNAGFDGLGNTLDSALWEYRGTATNPDNTQGSRGAYGGATPIDAPTTSNGFIIFDSDYLDNNGVAGNFGNGKAPAPHKGTLTTPTIDLSGYSNVELSFNSYHRYFEGRALVLVSTNGGTSFTDTIAVHPLVGVNSSNPIDERVGLNLSAIAGNQSNVKIQFLFDGTFDDPGASGSGQGYYFWMIDDIEINELPKHALRFTEWNDSPANAAYFGPVSGLSSKLGIMAKRASDNMDNTRAIEFDANAFNYGWGTLNNVELNVDVIYNGTLVGTYTSTGDTTLASGEIATYNTMNTFGNAYTPTATGTYGLVFRATSDSAEVIGDTIDFFVTEDLMSLDWGDFANRLGTGARLGDDGGAMASRIDITDPVYLTSVWVGISTASSPGATVEIEVYDTAGFDYVAGFPSSALKGASASYTLTQQDVDDGFFEIPVFDASNGPVYMNGDSYFISVVMYSNAGANPIYLANSTIIEQHFFAAIMYDAVDARWWSGFSGSLALNSPFIRARVTKSVGVAEQELESKVTIAPNPAVDFVNVNFTDIDGNFDVTMTDITGRVMVSQTVEVLGATQHTIDVSNLSAGVYMLNVNNGSASVTHKITVQ